MATISPVFDLEVEPMEEVEGAAGGLVGLFEAADLDNGRRGAGFPARRAQLRRPHSAGGLGSGRWRGLSHPVRSILP